MKKLLILLFLCFSISLYSQTYEKDLSSDGVTVYKAGTIFKLDKDVIILTKEKLSKLKNKSNADDEITKKLQERIDFLEKYTINIDKLYEEKIKLIENKYNYEVQFRKEIEKT